MRRKQRVICLLLVLMALLWRVSMCDGKALLYGDREGAWGVCFVGDEVIGSAGAVFDFVTYNTHLFGNSWAGWLPGSTDDDVGRAKAIAAGLVARGVDFVALQEVFDGDLMSLFEGMEGYGSVRVDRAARGWWWYLFPKVVPDGLVLAGRYGLCDCERVLLRDSAGGEHLVTRSVVCVYVPAGVCGASAPFCLFTTHTHWGGDDEQSRDVRMRNIRQLRDVVDDYCGRHGDVGFVVLGDLNITQGSADYDELMEIFDDCGDACGDNVATCDPTANRLLQKFHPRYGEIGRTKIDYILFSSSDWEVVYSRVCVGEFVDEDGGDLSDHYPLYAMLRQRG